ncbi:MAG: hypothetical protein ACRD40_09430 [Candidatus Acidiferrales bacterium]
MSQITLQLVKDFMEQEGSIGVIDHEGITRMLYPALHEYLGVAQTSNHLWHKGTWHSREQFLQLYAQLRIEVPA